MARQAVCLIGLVLLGCAVVAQSGGRSYTLRPANLAMMGVGLTVEYEQESQELTLRLPGQVCNRKGECGRFRSAKLLMAEPLLEVALALEPVREREGWLQARLKVAEPQTLPLTLKARYAYAQLGGDAVDVYTFRPADFLEAR